jgi:hypothetical protein
LAALATLAAPAAAQEQTFTVPAEADAPRESWISVHSDATAGARRPGGFGWATIEALNPDSAAHELELGVGDMSELGGARIHRVVKLGARRAHARLAAGALRDLVQLAVGARRRRRPGRLEHRPVLPGSASTLPSILALTDDDELRRTAALDGRGRDARCSWMAAR